MRRLQGTPVAAARQLPLDFTCVLSIGQASLPTSCLHIYVYVINVMPRYVYARLRTRILGQSDRHAPSDQSGCLSKAYLTQPGGSSKRTTTSHLRVLSSTRTLCFISVWFNSQLRPSCHRDVIGSLFVEVSFHDSPNFSQRWNEVRRNAVTRDLFWLL